MNIILKIKCFEDKDMPYEKKWKINMMQIALHVDCHKNILEYLILEKL